MLGDMAATSPFVIFIVSAIILFQKFATILPFSLMLHASAARHHGSWVVPNTQSYVKSQFYPAPISLLVTVGGSSISTFFFPPLFLPPTHPTMATEAAAKVMSGRGRFSAPALMSDCPRHSKI